MDALLQAHAHLDPVVEHAVADGFEHVLAVGEGQACYVRQAVVSLPGLPDKRKSFSPNRIGGLDLQPRRLVARNGLQDALTHKRLGREPLWPVPAWRSLRYKQERTTEIQRVFGATYQDCPDDMSEGARYTPR